MSTTMKAWQYTSANGALEKNLHLNENAAQPSQALAESDVLVEVISMGLNPVDYKLAEMGWVAKAMIRTPATPGLDFSGRVVSTGSAMDSFKTGDVVFGRLDPTQHGTLGQFIIAKYDGCALLPDGVETDQGAAVGTAGLTAYQTIVPNVKAGDRVFINGGSGGTGTFGIQIAKAIGCHVTVSCSTGKALLCRELGADEVIDYTTTSISQKLKENGQIYSVVVDNVGTSPLDLYKASDDFLLPQGKFVHVGGAASLESAKTIAKRLLLPGILGGGKRKFEVYSTKNKHDDLVHIGQWVMEGKVKAVIDRVFEFGDAPKAIERLKMGRNTGKVIVHITQNVSIVHNGCHVSQVVCTSSTRH